MTSELDYRELVSEPCDWCGLGFKDTECYFCHRISCRVCAFVLDDETIECRDCLNAD